ncbi:MAG: radical SAM protein [Thermoplasmatota archaeon]
MDTIRVSAGTASLLGLADWNLEVEPTTLYFMLGERCHGRCSYCTQRGALLSRVRWPRFPFDDVAARLPGRAERICLQTRHYPGVVDDVVRLMDALDGNPPVSVSMNPVERETLEKLHEAGVGRVGIGLDCCTPELFKTLKHKVPSWKQYLQGLQDARDVFGAATAHIILGLGESDRDAIEMIQWLTRHDIQVALFAHYPLHGGTRPSVERYRYLQLVRHLLEHGRYNDTLMTDVSPGDMAAAARTSGCPGCNRPFYNERVRGPLYNYPRPLTRAEQNRASKEVQSYVRLHRAHK